MFSFLKSIVWRVFQFSSLSIVIMIVLLSLSILCLFVNKCSYEVKKDFESNFVDSKIDCLPWSVSGCRPPGTTSHSPTAAEVAKRIEEEKRVLNLKMSAYG